MRQQSYGRDRSGQRRQWSSYTQTSMYIREENALAQKYEWQIRDYFFQNRLNIAAVRDKAWSLSRSAKNRWKYWDIVTNELVSGWGATWQRRSHLRRIPELVFDNLYLILDDVVDRLYEQYAPVNMMAIGEGNPNDWWDPGQEDVPWDVPE